jgi:ribosome-binding factor A
MFKKEKLEELIRSLAAQFLAEEADPSSLITITRATASTKLETATIFFTVYPETREKSALDFVKRKRKQFRDFVKSHSRLRYVPFVDFQIDAGEKNRQHIDELSRNS